MASAAPKTPSPTPRPRPRELILVGGGHAHVEVLRQLPTFDPRVRVTLVARELLAPYSGMLPGVVAGAYSARQAQIDVAALGAGPRCRVVRGEARAVDVPGRRVLVRKDGEDEPDWMPYDLLSINVGIEPAAAEGGGLVDVTPVKPVSSFLARWAGEVLPKARAALAARAEEGEEEGEGAAFPLFRVAIVGGGAGGVELAFAAAQRLEREWERAWRGRRRRRPSFSSSPDPPPPAPVRVTLYSRGTILPEAPPAARAKILALASRPASLVRIREDRGGVEGVIIAEGTTAGGGLALRLSKSAAAEEELEPFDACLWCTQAAAPSWFAPPSASVGLPLDARGFLRVRPTLQLASSSPEGGGALDDVFAAGDAAAIEGYPRPKAGVYAVRAGPFLAENLRRRARWLAEEASSSSSPPPPPPPALLEFRPQKHALALISAGTKWAMVVRPPFPLCPSGEWAWRWKDRIDRAFVRRYDPLSAARAGEGGGDDGDGGGLSG